MIGVLTLSVMSRVGFTPTGSVWGGRGWWSKWTTTLMTDFDMLDFFFCLSFERDGLRLIMHFDHS